MNEKSLNFFNLLYKISFPIKIGKYWGYQLGANPAGEIYSFTSQCVVGRVAKTGNALPNIDRALCYKTECSADGRTVTFVLDGNTKVSCNRAGVNVNLPSPYSGFIKCPDPTVYCKKKVKFPLSFF